MFTCAYCEQVMDRVDGCTKLEIHIEGLSYHRVRFGDEEYKTARRAVLVSLVRCYACNARSGMLHHLGCEVEQCPKGCDYLIGCGHLQD